MALFILIPYLIIFVSSIIFSFAYYYTEFNSVATFFKNPSQSVGYSFGKFSNLLLLLYVIVIITSQSLSLIFDPQFNSIKFNVLHIFTFILAPWIVIFLFGMFLLYIYPKMKLPFANTFGLLFTYFFMNTNQKSLFKDDSLLKQINTLNMSVQDTQGDESMSFIEAIRSSIFPTLNDLFSKNSLNIFNSYKSLLSKNKSWIDPKQPFNATNTFISYVLKRDVISSFIWYSLFGFVAVSTSMNFLENYKLNGTKSVSFIEEEQQAYEASQLEKSQNVKTTKVRKITN